MGRIYVILLVLCFGAYSCTPPQTQDKMDRATAKSFDWQGHRGARGLLPENTVPSFIKALEYPQVATLELDLAVSQDSLLVVSHEPWMSHHICSHPDGRPVEAAEEDSLLLFGMPYEVIQGYDCGLRGNERFPQQVPMAVYKPLFRDVVRQVDNYCKEKQRPLPRFNIEIKHAPAYDGVKAPAPYTFAQLVAAELKALGIEGRSCVQSFDVRPLQHLHKMSPGQTTALLVENPNGVAVNLEALGYTPEIYSPYYKMVTAGVVEEVHQRGMKLIPWTVNDTVTMKALIQLGVDGIITDYPNLIAEVEE